MRSTKTKATNTDMFFSPNTYTSKCRTDAFSLKMSGDSWASSSPEGGCTTRSTLPSLSSCYSADPLPLTPRLVWCQSATLFLKNTGTCFRTQTITADKGWTPHSNENSSKPFLIYINNVRLKFNQRWRHRWGNLLQQPNQWKDAHHPIGCQKRQVQ